MACKLGKFSTPKPVIGSQPSVAFQLAPCAPKALFPTHPTEEPPVTSLKMLALRLYNSGLRNPSAVRFELSRAALSSATWPANVAALALVPLTR